MRLTVIGCAGSFPGPDSPASCYLIEADGFRLVIDMGNGSLGTLQRHAALADIDAVILSHLHADHCVDLYSFRIAREYVPGGPMRVIPVYAPAGGLARIAGVHGVDDEDGLSTRFAFSTLAPGHLKVGPFSIETGHMNHPVETFGFRLTHGGSSIAYSADTGETSELIRLARDADVALFEASYLTQPGLPPNLHLTAREAAEHATRAGAGRLVLTHLIPWNDPERTREEAATAYDGKLTLAKSGLSIELLLPVRDVIPPGPPVPAATSQPFQRRFSGVSGRRARWAYANVCHRTAARPDRALGRGGQPRRARRGRPRRHGRRYPDRRRVRP